MGEYTETRVVQSVSHGGQWVVQGWWPANEVWADIGDPVGSFREAQAKQRALVNEDKSTGGH